MQLQMYQRLNVYLHEHDDYIFILMYMFKAKEDQESRNEGILFAVKIDCIEEQTFNNVTIHVHLLTKYSTLSIYIFYIST